MVSRICRLVLSKPTQARMPVPPNLSFFARRDDSSDVGQVDNLRAIGNRPLQSSVTRPGGLPIRRGLTTCPTFAAAPPHSLQYDGRRPPRLGGGPPGLLPGGPPRPGGGGALGLGGRIGSGSGIFNGKTTTCRNGPVPALSLRMSVSLRKQRCMMRRSRLLIGLKWNGRPVCFTRSAAATALKRSSSMRSSR